MPTSTPIKNAKVKMQPREAGRAPPRKQSNDVEDHEKSGSGENDVQNERKEDDGVNNEGDSHLETWVGFVKRSRI